MKDIAIYRLQRVEKALERLNSAVARLEAASEKTVRSPAPEDGRKDEVAEALRADLANLKQDYDALHAVAKTVADRLDATIGQISSDAAGTA